MEARHKKRAIKGGAGALFMAAASYFGSIGRDIVMSEINRAHAKQDSTDGIVMILTQQEIMRAHPNSMGPWFINQATLGPSQLQKLLDK